MKAILHAVCCGALLAAPSAAFAQERPPFELRLERALDSLGGGREDWREALGQVAWRPSPGQTWLVGYRATERFGQRDREITAAAYIPFSKGGPTLHLEGTASPTHRVLARNTMLAQVALRLGGGWVAGAGGRLARYGSGDVATAMASIEKYLGEWRFGYTGYLARPEGGSWGATHRLAAAWYRSELSQAGVSAARGREQENVPPVGIVTSDVRNLTANGVFPLSDRFGLALEWARQEQGDLYTRRTVRIGTRVLF